MVTRLLAFLLIFLVRGMAADPLAIYLTWKDDPSTTMIVDWHVDSRATPPVLEVRRQGETEWKSYPGEEGAFPFLKRKVFRQSLDNLTPDLVYQFRFSKNDREYYFRTMPVTLSRPVRFAIGGDTRHRTGWLREMNKVAVSHGVDFVVLGGDLAYDNGAERNANLLSEWFETHKETFVMEDGRVVPVLVTIGNHEVRGGYITGKEAGALRAEIGTENLDLFRSRLAPYFYALFASPGQPGYRAIDFGNYLSFLLLDTNHTNPIEGQQTEWLKSALEERAGRPNIFPVYHVPAYPSVRGFDEPVSTMVRETWLPLFEKAGVKFAFENHDHAYKRTPPIAGGRPDPMGIVFLGDGAWGVEPREPHPVGETWYLERAESVRHCMIANVSPQGIRFEVFNNKNQLIDSFSSGF
jgi:hypothetical protein